jgi:peptidoglycan/LPS O-acetylase OafA/YrhL
MKIYFKNLDGLRFAAAFLVIMQHASDYRSYAVPTYSNVFKAHFADLGRYGVTLFFVLSGFLITYLLLTERKTTSTINIKKFYIRRILRIWPLYFAFGILVICTIDLVLRNFGIYDHSPILTNLIYLFTFTINFQLLFGAYNRGIIEVLWSVCVEEQFYAIWPWAIRWGYKKIRTLIVVFIGIGIFSSIVMHLLTENGFIHGHMNPVYIFPLCRFGHFGLGALAAYLLFDEKQYRKIAPFVKNKGIQAMMILLVLLICLRFIVFPHFVDDYFLDMVPAILYAYIILASVSGNFLFNLETRLIKRMGTYSYGIYIIHPSVAQISIAIFKKYIPNSFINYEILYPLFVTVLSVSLAGLSYELYEKRFLMLKKKFTIIQNHPV